MLRSMTGYGSGTASSGGADIRVEMKGVNSRYFDFSLKIPRAYMAMEDGLKKLVQGRVPRGKVDMFVTIDASKSASSIPRVNIEAVKAYVAAIAELKRELKKSGVTKGIQLNDSFGYLADITFADLLRLPDVLTPARDEAGAEEASAAVFEASKLALTEFEAMRAREGARLGDDIASKLGDIERLTEFIERRAPEVVSAYKERLRARIEEALGAQMPDEARLLTEVAIFADKVATDEETVRLRSHLAQARGMLELDESVGRKLDFIIQEMNREANTIGSKSGDAETSRAIVELKAELEKLREQAQNIE